MSSTEFESHLGAALDRLRAVLIARHGVDMGNDVHAEVTTFAWEHRDRLCTLENPTGYLFRVSQSRVRRYRRWRRVSDLPVERPHLDQIGDNHMSLNDALARLSADERTVAVLIHAYGYSYDEAADLMGTSVGAVRNRLHRGMVKLRRLLNEEINRAHD